QMSRRKSAQFSPSTEGRTIRLLRCAVLTYWAAFGVQPSRPPAVDGNATWIPPVGPVAMTRAWPTTVVVIADSTVALSPALCPPDRIVQYTDVADTYSIVPYRNPSTRGTDTAFTKAPP